VRGADLNLGDAGRARRLPWPPLNHAAGQAWRRCLSRRQRIGRALECAARSRATRARLLLRRKRHRVFPTPLLKSDRARSVARSYGPGPTTVSEARGVPIPIGFSAMDEIEICAGGAALSPDLTRLLDAPRALTSGRYHPPLPVSRASRSLCAGRRQYGTASRPSSSLHARAAPAGAHVSRRPPRRRPELASSASIGAGPSLVPCCCPKARQAPRT